MDRCLSPEMLNHPQCRETAITAPREWRLSWSTKGESLCEGVCLQQENSDASPFRGHDPGLEPARREPQVRIILPQRQPVLGAAREHPIRLVRPLCHEVVDEHADVGLVAAHHKGFAPLDLEAGVSARDDALRGGFLVARGAADLCPPRTGRGWDAVYMYERRSFTR